MNTGSTMPLSNLPKSFAIAVAVGLGIAIIIMVVGRLAGFGMPASVVGGVTAAVVAASVVNLRRRT
jgi:hypothetical protein